MTRLLDHSNVVPPPLIGTYARQSQYAKKLFLWLTYQNTQSHEDAQTRSKPIHVFHFLQELPFDWLQGQEEPN